MSKEETEPDDGRSESPLTPERYEAAQPPDDDAVHEAQSESLDSEERRRFLTRTGALVAFLSAGVGIPSQLAEGADATPIEDSRDAQVRREALALQSVLDEASKTGDINRAIAEKGAELPSEAIGILRRLTPGDLQAVSILNIRLSALRALWGFSFNVNGVIGM